MTNANNKFTEVTLDLIDEGRVVKRANEDLQDMQRRLLAYIRRYGEGAAKAKAEMTLKITLIAGEIKIDKDDPQAVARPEGVAIKVQSVIKLPSRPSNVSIAIPVTDDNGQETLFVRKSGSDRGNPRQGKLATDEGIRVDPGTGEVIEEPAEKGA